MTVTIHYVISIYVWRSSTSIVLVILNEFTIEFKEKNLPVQIILYKKINVCLVVFIAICIYNEIVIELNCIFIN